MSYFAQPTLGRDQFVLIPTTLEDTIPDNHEVRLLDDILQTPGLVLLGGRVLVAAWTAANSSSRGRQRDPIWAVASCPV